MTVFGRRDEAVEDDGSFTPRVRLFWARAVD
jgi:hypothetical protein